MANYRRYSVRAGMSGRMIVDVPLGALSLRGEKDAVVAYAWLSLMGQDELGRDVNKHSETRRILIEEHLSRYESHRPEVYTTFAKRIRFRPICNIIK